MADRSHQKTVSALIFGALAAILFWSYIIRSHSHEQPPVVPPSSVEQPSVTPPTSEQEPTDSPVDPSPSIPNRELNIPPAEATPGDQSTDPVIKLGKDQLHNLKFSEARETFKKRVGTDVVAEYYLGLLAAFFGEKTEAQTHFHNVIVGDADELMKSVAQRLLDTYAIFETYRDGPPEFLDTLISREFLAAGEHELGIDKLRFITEEHPDYSDAWILLGSGYIVRGNYDQALASFKKSLPSEKPEAYYWLGNAYLYQDTPQKALAAFKEAENKGYGDIYKIKEKMGDSYVLLRQYQSAVRSYEEALAIDSSYPELYVRPVWIYIELLNKPNNALSLAQQAEKLFPNSAVAHNLVGWSYLALGDYPRAKVALDTAHSLDKSLPEVYLNLGAYYEATGDKDTALDQYEEAVKRDPEGPVGERAQDAFRSLVETQ